MVQKNYTRILVLGLVVLALFAAFSAGCTSTDTVTGNTTAADNGTRTITDMAGRELTVPSEINKVLCTGPPTYNLVYMLAPEKLAGWYTTFNDKEKEFIPAEYQNLPNSGGWYGKQTGNYETFLQTDPDILLDSFNEMGNTNETLDERQENMGSIPVIGVLDTTNASAYSAPIRYVGKLLGEEEQAQKLTDFYEDILGKVNERVAKMTGSEKPTVYYAEGPEGLQTDPAGSAHSQLIELCGGTNIADCKINQGYGMTEVSMEQVIGWNPDIIIAGSSDFYDSVYNDSRWKDITAVKNGQVYLAPVGVPFSWFDRPPGVNRIIGIAWTAKVLHPDLFEDFDMRELAQYYYTNFIHQPLTEEQMDELGI
ncbi:iron complex transport system substrate-binding protein [Methanomicrobium sp. W14]|uniref:ABC transporter substrate-binding protein n=1 Tax=Methanomicrobium sp. W14 TaxID=2817839 RepID=UPI001AEA31FD|nr:ABC transporter substrate-binding protein [Methanomicrobium sp. W14]MBP2134337.1 iron complex transport system substrate-binding protein [Methanomicrobium sp. W14]